MTVTRQLPAANRNALVSLEFNYYHHYCFALFILIGKEHVTSQMCN